MLTLAAGRPSKSVRHEDKLHLSQRRLNEVVPKEPQQVFIADYLLTLPDCKAKARLFPARLCVRLPRYFSSIFPKTTKPHAGSQSAICTVRLRGRFSGRDDRGGRRLP